MIVGALDNIFAFDVTDNLFTVLQQVDAAPAVIDAGSRPRCLNKQYNNVRSYFVTLSALIVIKAESQSLAIVGNI